MITDTINDPSGTSAKCNILFVYFYPLSIHVYIYIHALGVRVFKGKKRGREGESNMPARDVRGSKTAWPKER
jgi:hypothetical protein